MVLVGGFEESPPQRVQVPLRAGLHPLDVGGQVADGRGVVAAALVRPAP